MSLDFPNRIPDCRKLKNFLLLVSSPPEPGNFFATFVFLIPGWGLLLLPSVGVYALERLQTF